MSPNNANAGFLQEELFPIRTVSKITGVNSVTLRAWERRYGLITPKRTETGHRLFSKDDIQMIQQAKKLLNEGVSISQISRQLKSSRQFETLMEDQPSTVWQKYIEKMSDSVVEFNEEILDEVYQEALSFHGIDDVTNKLIIPLLRHLGERWAKAEGKVAEEHFFSVYLRNKLGAQYHHRRGRNNGPLLIVACMPDKKHEFAILLFSLIAHQHNYRLIVLGAEMPLEEMAYVIQKTKADGLVLSACKNCRTSASELELIANLNKVSVFVGGDITEQQKSALIQVNAHILPSDYDTTIKIINHKLKPQTV